MQQGAQEIIEKRKQYILPCITHYYEDPPEFVRGEMQYLYDNQGKKYLDCFAGVVTVNSGHCHPEIASAIIRQVQTLQHTTTLYLTRPMVDLAEKLAEITPGSLQRSFICNSGTEATEGACLLAKIHTGAHEFIALRHSFHGRSIIAMTLTGQSSWRIGGPYVFGVNFVSSAYCYRCPFGQSYPGCDLECAKDVENIIRTSTSTRVAAMIAEPIQGNGGVITPPPPYFKKVQEILKRYGALLISDEVQTGFGRTGGKWFGIEQWGVEPDILTMAKGFGNGWPIGGFIAKPEIADSIKGGQHFSTYGGNPVSSVAALANIRVIEKSNLAQNAATVGAYFKDKLLELQQKYSLIGDVRGMGLMLGMELVKDRKTKEPAAKEMARVMEICKDDGVLIGKGGLDGNVIRIKPPLCITKGDVDSAAAVMDKAFAQVQK
ncbi:MAG: aspartate aminotransferase family protein [Armatimonadetes bacterium]|nr:aspartate aminotransferase family protein [Armatimonadota bacterium]